MPAITPVEDIVENRAQRKNELLEEFARRRDEAEFQAATNAWQQGDVQRCRESLQRLLSRNPRHVEAHALLARLHEQAGRWQDALAQVKEALVVEPKNELLLAQRENLLGRLRPSSVKLVQRAEKSGNDDLIHAARLVSDGEAALAQGDADSAIDLFNKAITALPHDPQIPTTAALAALRLNRPDIAARLAEASAGRFGDSAALHRILGVARYRMGDYESSQVALQQALSLDNTSAITYFLQGCTLTRLGKSEAAEAHFRWAGRLDPQYDMDCRDETTIRR